MAKKRAAEQITVKKKTETPPAAIAVSKKWAITDFQVQALILMILAFVFYSNTFSNENALDDNPIIVNNPNVQAGVSGISSIMTADALRSFLEHENTGAKLVGGRYRPLSMVTFAIEQQALGINQLNRNDSSAAVRIAIKEKIASDMHVRHVINVLLYMLSAAVLLAFLRKIVFPATPLAAFLAALIFTIHPIHTEVVANVKSRDEILSLLFICLTCMMAIRHTETNKFKHLLTALSCFFLALLSKEYAIGLVLLLPFTYYYNKEYSIGKALRECRPYLIPLGIYMALRFSSVMSLSGSDDADVINNPYLFASGMQKIASIIAVLFNYLKLLVIPYPLSADYSYKQLPYANLANIKVIISAVLYLSLLTGLLYWGKKRHPLGYAIAFYVIFLAMVSNIFINVGAPMGERFIYHSSVGFAIVVAFMLNRLFIMTGKGKTGQGVLAVISLIFIGSSAFIVLPRNKEWHNDRTLFLKDVVTVPNSTVANAFAGGVCIDHADDNKDTTEQKKWLTKGIAYLDKAIAIHPKYINAYMNRGIGNFKLKRFDKSLADCDTVRMHFPDHPSLPYLSYILSDHYFNIAMTLCGEKNHEQAIPYFAKAIEASPLDADLWYNMGYAFYCLHRYTDCKEAAKVALKISPGYPRAQALLKAAEQDAGTSGK